MVMKSPLRFATDASLGKLGRHLRAAGFDTRCEHQSRKTKFWNAIGMDRIVLTRATAVRKRCANRGHLFIRDNDPWRQMRQVVRELKIDAADLKPFSRCLDCNRRIRAVERLTIRCCVPDYVWQRHTSFQACDHCRRIYWPGSHHQRMGRRLANLFSAEGKIDS